MSVFATRFEGSSGSSRLPLHAVLHSTTPVESFKAGSSSIAPDANNAHQEAHQAHRCSYILCPYLAGHLGFNFLTIDLTRVNLNVAGLFGLPLQREPSQAVIPVLNTLSAEQANKGRP